MPRSFNIKSVRLPPLAAFKDTKTLVRMALGVLLLANLIAAMFAFHVFGTSPEAINAELTAATIRLQGDQARVNRSRRLTLNIDQGRNQSETFLASYMTGRRHTYSTIIGEVTQTAKAAGMKMKEATIAPLEPIEGSDDLDMMTVSANFEGGYIQLVKFVNALDRSPRFLIIDSMQAAPQATGDLLSVNVKLAAFVKDDTGGGQ